MRQLSKVEKQIIKQINSQRNGNDLRRLLGGYAKEIVLEIDKSEKKVKAIYLNNKVGVEVNSEELTDYFLKRIFFINTLLKLLVYLEKEGYIVSYVLSNTHESKRLIGDDELLNRLKSKDGKHTSFNFDDEFAIGTLIRYRDSYIISTEELVVLEKSNFKTQEQIRFRKTYVATVLAIIISFLIGISSLWISIVGSNKPLKINQEQLDSIVTRLDRIAIKESITNKKEK